MKKFNTKGIILRSINYKDKDKIYTLFTKDYGKLTAVGRGVRKISSRRGGNLDSLNYVTIKLTENDKGFRNIDEVIIINSFRSIKSDYDKSLLAYYYAELINRNIEENTEDEHIFNLFKKVLEILDKDKLNIDILTLFFEIQLLKNLGYFPKLPSDVVISTIIKKLLRADFKDIDISNLETTKIFIKNHIYTHLSDNFKSLDL